MKPKSTLYYVHDPMCSWCWAYRPVLAQIHKALLGQLDFVNVLGGLAADTDEPMSAEMAAQIQGHWQRIEQEVGTHFNYDFWKKADITPMRSTYPACRAVIAAQKQDAEEPMILAIQQAYYLRAMNPSDEDTLLQLADELDLDFDAFMHDLSSSEVDEILQQEIFFCRQQPIAGFPSLLLQVGEQIFNIQVDYHSASNTLVRIAETLKKHNNK